MEPPTGLRVVFLGNDPWSVPALEALASSSHPLALAMTRVPRPARRGSKPKPIPTAVAEAARALAVPVREVETVRSGPGFDAIAGAAPDVLAVVAYGEILPVAVLGLPRVAPVNLHFSLLPKLRGASPVQTALLQGLPSTGVTTMIMGEGLDTGPILLQAEEAIGDEDDAGSLGARLATLGAELLVRTLDRLAVGDLEASMQDAEEATHAPKLTERDRRLDWNDAAVALVRRVRALAPDPGASARFRGEVLKVLRAEATPDSGEPGIVLKVDRSGFVVGAGAGALRPLEVAPAGRRRMPADAFARGHHPQPGERLG